MSSIVNGEAFVGGLLWGIGQATLYAWPVILLIVIVKAIRWSVAAYERKRLSRSGILEIDRMDGRTFEKYLEVLFHKLGYAVERTRYVGDYGADLVTRKDGVKMVIQAKRHKRSVGVKAVQEAVAAKGYYGCEAAMVVTSSTFTKQAIELARANSVALWDRNRLVEALLSVQVSTEALKASPAPQEMVSAPLPTVISPTPDGSLDTSACVVCGTPVTEKVRNYCLSRPGVFGGDIRCFEHQRSARSAAREPSTTRGSGRMSKGG